MKKTLNIIWNVIAIILIVFGTLLLLAGLITMLSNGMAQKDLNGVIFLMGILISSISMLLFKNKGTKIAAIPIYILVIFGIILLVLNSSSVSLIIYLIIAAVVALLLFQRKRLIK